LLTASNQQSDEVVQHALVERGAEGLVVGENGNDNLVQGTPADCGKESTRGQTGEVGIGVEIEVTGEDVVQGNLAAPDCGEESVTGEDDVEDCREEEVTPLQTTPFVASEIKQELQSKVQIEEQYTENQVITLTPQHRLFSEEQMETGQDIENQSITPEHFLSQLLGGDHIQGLQRKKELLEDNIEDEVSREVGSGVEKATVGSINDALLDAAADNIDKEVAEKEQELEEEPGQRDTCPLCAESGEVFSAGQNEMATHFVQVHNIMDQGYECTECGYKSRHRSHLKDHINAMHLEAKFKCDLCDYETKYKNRIKSHRVAVHKIGGLPCPSCDYVASEPWVLSQHVKFMHRMKDLNGTEGDMRFKCHFCDYKAAQKSHLLCHERAIHKQVQLTCQLCGFQSRWKSRLNSHIKKEHMSLFIHCDHCEFKATERFALKVHIKKQHGDITFACFKCSEDFITRLDLKKHLSDVHFMEIV